MPASSGWTYCAWLASYPARSHGGLPRVTGACIGWSATLTARLRRVNAVGSEIHMISFILCCMLTRTLPVAFTRRGQLLVYILLFVVPTLVGPCLDLAKDRDACLHRRLRQRWWLHSWLCASLDYLVLSCGSGYYLIVPGFAFWKTTRPCCNAFAPAETPR